MSIVWLDGLDNLSQNSDLGNGNYELTFNGPTITTVNPRTGLVACTGPAGTNGGLIGKSISLNTPKIGSAIYPTAFGGNEQFTMALWNGYSTSSGTPGAVPPGNGNGGLALQLATGGNVRLMFCANGTSSTQLAITTTGPVPLNAYSYLELDVNLPAGTADVWLNGNVHLISVTGITWAQSVFDQAWWGIRNTYAAAVTWDDLYIESANRLGAQRCYCLFVNADQSPQNWTKSGGSNAFALLNAPNYSTSNYIQGVNIGDASQFGCQSIPAANAVINAMRLCSVLELDAAGSALAAMSATIGSGTYTGANKSPSTSPVYYNDLFTLGGSTTVAQVNSMHVDMTKTG